jgi:hypothetical protein
MLASFEMSTVCLAVWNHHTSKQGLERNLMLGAFVVVPVESPTTPFQLTGWIKIHDLETMTRFMSPAERGKIELS